MKATDLTKEQLVKLVVELVDALDYCGWGDSYEREGSADLRKRVHAMDLPNAD